MRTGTPRATAMSGLSELSSRTRDSSSTTVSATRPDATRAGTVAGAMTKMEPNRTVNDAPVVLVVADPR